MDVLHRDVGAAQPAHQERPDGVGRLRGAELAALAVNCARALDADVFRAIGDDQRVAERHAVAGGEGIEVAVVGRARAAKEDCAGLEAEGDAVLELDRAGEVAPGGKHHGASALRARLVNEFLDRGGVERRPIAHDAAPGRRERERRRCDRRCHCDEQDRQRDPPYMGNATECVHGNLPPAWLSSRPRPIRGRRARHPGGGART